MCGIFSIHGKGVQKGWEAGTVHLGGSEFLVLFCP